MVKNSVIINFRHNFALLLKKFVSPNNTSRYRVHITVARGQSIEVAGRLIVKSD